MSPAPAKPNWNTARTAEEVGKLLQEKFPDLEIVGFDERYKPDIRSVREFADAIYDMLTRYRQVELTKVSITKPTSRHKNVYAWATASRTEGYLSTTIDLNADLARDWPAYCQAAQEELDTGWAFSRPDRPVYSTIIHEFGHAVDYATMKTPREKEARHEKTEQALFEAWERAKPGIDYHDWLRQQLSEYSFIDGNKYNNVEPWEVLAEAFTDAVLNGPNARETSKALHKLMEDSLIEARGV